MSDTLQEYKCPCCGGAISFDSNIQKMKCPYCDTEFDVETLAEYDDELRNEKSDDLKWDTSEKNDWQDTDGLISYICKSCGGEIIGDETTAATSCPFCGNPVIMTAQFSGKLRPDLVIPFKLDKKEARKRFFDYLSGKRLLPKVFKDENHIDEIKGIYVPFWLFDADAEADIRCRATRTRFWSDRNFNYKETGHYLVFRGGDIGFDKVPVDGSAKMPNDLMESLEPFDIGEAVDFKTAYLAGYFADKYDVSAEDSAERANERIKRSVEDAFMSTINGYDGIRTEKSTVRLHNGRVKYALYPVWILNTEWNGERYVFAMNGQTGKFVGDLPVDKKSATKWTLGLTAVFGAVIYGAILLLYGGGLW